MVGAVADETPAQAAGDLADRFGMRVVTLAVIGPHGFGAAENGGVADVAGLEAQASAERKILFRRIDDLHEIPMRAAIGEALHGAFDGVERLQEIRQPHQFALPLDGQLGRQIGLVRRFAGQTVRHAAERNTSRGGRCARTQQSDALAAAHQKRGQGQRQHGGALPFLRHRFGIGVAHADGGIAPEPHGFGRFPFAFTHEEMLRFGRLPPIDGRGSRVFRPVAPELPEGFAHAGLAPAMHAEPGRGGKTFGLDQKRRQRRGEDFGFFARTVAQGIAQIGVGFVCRVRHQAGTTGRLGIGRRSPA